MFCGICGTWLGNSGLMFADALWNAGMAIDNSDLVDRVCGNVDTTLARRRGQVLQEVSFQTTERDESAA